MGNKLTTTEVATSKDTLIRNLVSYDVEYFVAFIRTSDAAKIALATMMMEGFVGYNHWSEEELRKECVRRELL
ncbi:MAG: hypothetical protein C4516_03685 [Oxalobacter sp.]|nr:MAG: hypothetical protein C4516_03685 [Oxalobacter sp.]